jgi:hypothetical protein
MPGVLRPDFILSWHVQTDAAQAGSNSRFRGSFGRKNGDEGKGCGTKNILVIAGQILNGKISYTL